MKTISTETIIPMGEYKTTYSEQRIIIRVEDLAAGPFLLIEGVDDQPEDSDEEWRKHSMCFSEEQEIDEFCAICKKILKDANDTEKSGGKK